MFILKSIRSSYAWHGWEEHSVVFSSSIDRNWFSMDIKKISIYFSHMSFDKVKDEKSNTNKKFIVLRHVMGIPFALFEKNMVEANWKHDTRSQHQLLQGTLLRMLKEMGKCTQIVHINRMRSKQLYVHL